MGLEILKNKLKELRKERDLTQKEMAKSLGVNPATFSAYESGKNNPSLEVLVKISELYDVSLDWLCGLSDCKKNNERKFSTYSEIIQALFNIQESLTSYNNFSIDELSDGDFGLILYRITYRDEQIQDFLSDWEKMLNLYNNDNIDNEVYELWKEKTIKKYNIEIDYIPF